MHAPIQLLPALTLVALPLAASAQEVVSVGGSGGLACSNANDPPTLDDGITPATGTITFDFDGALDRLTVTVENTSPVTAGVPNPLVTDAWFNLPNGAVTSLTPVSQTDGDGLASSWLISADYDLTDGGNGAGCMGAFSVHLANPGGMSQGIANASADTTTGTPINGPVTFVFDLAGPGVDTLTSLDFAASLSTNPPGSGATNTSLKFQGGGLAGASDKISSAPGCIPGGWMNGEPCIGNTVEFVMSAGAGCHGCLLWSLDPGPTDFGGGLVVPLGFPASPLLVVDPFPGEGFVTLDVTVPNDPIFVGTEIYFVVALQDPVTEAITIGDQFSVTICQ